MLMPSIFTNTYFNDFFEDPFKSLDYNTSGLMTTDVKDTKDGYEMTMNLPGVKKEDIQAEQKDGQLTINAVSNSSVKQDDIKAKFEDGTLKLTIPKETAKPAVEEKKYVSIEG